MKLAKRTVADLDAFVKKGAKKFKSGRKSVEEIQKHELFSDNLMEELTQKGGPLYVEEPDYSKAKTEKEKKDLKKNYEAQKIEMDFIVSRLNLTETINNSDSLQRTIKEIGIKNLKIRFGDDLFVPPKKDSTELQKTGGYTEKDNTIYLSRFVEGIGKVKDKKTNKYIEETPEEYRNRLFMLNLYGKKSSEITEITNRFVKYRYSCPNTFAHEVRHAWQHAQDMGKKNYDNVKAMVVKTMTKEADAVVFSLVALKEVQLKTGVCFYLSLMNSPDYKDVFKAFNDAIKDNPSPKQDDLLLASNLGFKAWFQFKNRRGAYDTAFVGDFIKEHWEDLTFKEELDETEYAKKLVINGDNYIKSEEFKEFFRLETEEGTKTPNLNVAITTGTFEILKEMSWKPEIEERLRLQLSGYPKFDYKENPQRILPMSLFKKVSSR